MTINSTPNRRTSVANAGDVQFTFNFTVDFETDLQVFRRPENEEPSDSSQILVLNQDYQVYINGTSGGVIVLTAPALQDEIIIIQTDRDADRDTDFGPDKLYSANNVNAEFDNQLFLLKQTQVKTDSMALRYPSTSLPAEGDLVLPIIEEGNVPRMAAGGWSQYRIGSDDPSAEALRSELLAPSGDTIVGDANFTTVRQAIVALNQRTPQYLIDTSVVANTVTVAPIPDVPQYPALLIVRVSNTNTGASTLQINALTPVALRNVDGTSLQADTIISGSLYAFIFDGTNYRVLLTNTTPAPSNSILPPGFYKGLEWSPGDLDPEHDVKHSPGICRDALNTMNIELTTDLTKRIDAVWSAGDGAGGLASNNSLAAGDTLHAWVIAKPDGTSDIGFDKNFPPTGLLADAVGYTKYQYLDSVSVIDVASDIQIRQQKRKGDYVFYVDDFTDFILTQNNSTTAALISLTMPEIEAVAILYICNRQPNTAVGYSACYSAYSNAAIVPSPNYSNSSIRLNGGIPSQWETSNAGVPIQTNDLGQVYFVANSDSSNTIITTMGWILKRGAS